MKWLALLCCFLSVPAYSQEKSETREFLGQLGGRTALMHLYAIVQPDGSARITGEYMLLPTMQQRFVEGERSKQLGITFLKEGDTPILYGRPPSATLQGTWADGAFKGGRYGPGGQQRERFDQRRIDDGVAHLNRGFQHNGRRRFVTTLPARLTETPHDVFYVNDGIVNLFKASSLAFIRTFNTGAGSVRGISSDGLTFSVGDATGSKFFQL